MKHKNKKLIEEEEDTGIDPEILAIMESRKPINVSVSPGTLILSRLLFGKFAK